MNSIPSFPRVLGLFYLGVCFITLALGLTSCNSDAGQKNPSAFMDDEAANIEMVEREDNYGNLERYSRRKSDYARQGIFSKFDKEGHLLEQAQYENDTLHGIRVLFFEETGDTNVVENYNRGRFHGPYRVYYPSGKIELTADYVNNVMEGEVKKYYETGELMETVTFQDNEENGPFKEYYTNGNLKTEGFYMKGDNEHGLLKMFNEAGELVKTMNCQHGVCRTIWKAPGTE